MKMRSLFQEADAVEESGRLLSITQSEEDYFKNAKRKKNIFLNLQVFSCFHSRKKTEAILNKKSVYHSWPQDALTYVFR